MNSKETATDVVLIEQLNTRTTYALDGLLPNFAEVLGDCFTPDGSLTVQGADGVLLEPASRGREALVKACKHIANPEGVRHFSLNVMIDVDGDTAQLRAYSVVMSIKSQPRTILRTSLQADTLVRGPDGWRIAQRVMTIDPGGAFS